MRASAASTRLYVRVNAGAGRSEIVGRLGATWKIRVAPAPERGRANDALLGLLSDRLRVPVSDLTVIAGATRRDKVVELRGLSAEEASERLENVS